MVNSNAPTTTTVRNSYSRHYRNVMPKLHTDSTEWQKYLTHTISHMIGWKLVVKDRSSPSSTC